MAVKDRTELMAIIRKNVSEGLVDVQYYQLHSDKNVIVRCGQQLKAGRWWACAVSAAAYCLHKGIGLTELMQRIEQIHSVKGQQYASEATYLGNFLRIGRDMEMCPIKACKLYAHKHVDFFRECEKRGNLPDQLSPDGILERCADIVNYAGLGYCLDQMGE